MMLLEVRGKLVVVWHNQLDVTKSLMREADMVVDAVLPPRLR